MFNPFQAGFDPMPALHGEPSATVLDSCNPCLHAHLETKQLFATFQIHFGAMTILI